MTVDDVVDIIEGGQGDKYWHAEHPDFSFEDWQIEVANNDTRLGYWQWVMAQIAAV